MNFGMILGLFIIPLGIITLSIVSFVLTKEKEGGK